MTLAQVYVSGNVRRYHANPDMAHLGQTNADHQGRCVQLLLGLHASPSVELIKAVAHHDVGEMYASDLSGPFKAGHPALAEAHALIEQEYLRNMLGCDPVDGLANSDLWWLNFVDKLEAYCFMLTHASGEKLLHGWPTARERIFSLAEARAGLRQNVAELIMYLDARAW